MSFVWHTGSCGGWFDWRGYSVLEWNSYSGDIHPLWSDSPILNLPRPRIAREDIWSWSWEKSRLFSASSSYQGMMEKMQGNSAHASSSTGGKRCGNSRCSQRLEFSGGEWSRISYQLTQNCNDGKMQSVQCVVMGVNHWTFQTKVEETRFQLPTSKIHEDSRLVASSLGHSRPR